MREALNTLEHREASIDEVLELFDVIVPDHSGRLPLAKIRVPERVPHQLVLSVGCGKSNG